MYIQVCSFSKARDIVQKFRVSETTQKKSFQKHLKSRICWKGNAYYPAFSCFAGWSCPDNLLYLNTHTDGLVAEFPVLEHISSTSLCYIHFKKAFHISRKWKIDWGCEYLVRMQLSWWTGFLYRFYMVVMLRSNELCVGALKLKNSNCGINPFLWVKFYPKIKHVSQFVW